jgi:hypothetical protein
LQSLEIDAVTQVRVTNDYETNWAYGIELNQMHPNAYHFDLVLNLIKF